MSKRKRSIQAHMAHSHQNGPHISHRERNVYQLLVLVHPLWYLYAQPCSGPPKPQIDFTIRVSSQLQNWPADVFRVIQHHIISPPKRRQQLVAKTSIANHGRICCWKITITNTIIFYNLNTRSHYQPPSYHLDEARHPYFHFSKHIKYYGAMIMGIICNRRNMVLKTFSPRTCINIEQDSETKSSTAKHVPIFPANALIPKTAPNYLLRFNNVVVAENIYK